MITTAESGPSPRPIGWALVALTMPVPPPAAVTVTIALTSRAPSARYSFWKMSTANWGRLDFVSLAMGQLSRFSPAPTTGSESSVGVYGWASGWWAGTGG